MVACKYSNIALDQTTNEILNKRRCIFLRACTVLLSMDGFLKWNKILFLQKPWHMYVFFKIIKMSFFLSLMVYAHICEKHIAHESITMKKLWKIRMSIWIKDYKISISFSIAEEINQVEITNAMSIKHTFAHAARSPW